jgi:hypothetical protein
VAATRAYDVKLVIAVVLALGTIAGAVVAQAREPAPAVVRLTIHNSRFDKSVLTVRRGEDVHYVVRNLDPIAHELIIGPADVQLRHELGTEPLHGARPGEVSIPPGR